MFNENDDGIYTRKIIPYQDNLWVDAEITLTSNRYNEYLNLYISPESQNKEPGCSGPRLPRDNLKKFKYCLGMHPNDAIWLRDTLNKIYPSPKNYLAQAVTDATENIVKSKTRGTPNFVKAAECKARAQECRERASALAKHHGNLNYHSSMLPWLDKADKWDTLGFEYEQGWIGGDSLDPKTTNLD